MASTKITLNISNDQQLDEQLDELCSGLIATKKGLRQFCMAVKEVTGIIQQLGYPIPPEECGGGIGAGIYEGYRLGMARMAKLLISGGREGLDLRIIRKEKP